MKSLFKKITLTLTLLLSLNTIPAFASTTNEETIENLNAYIKTELEEFIKQNDISIEIDDINFKLKNDNIPSKDDVEKDIETLKESLLMNQKSSVEKQEIQPYLVNNGSYYTAKVWSGVPSFGYGYIQQDFSAKISSGKITSISMLGSSYQTGLIYAKWNANRSWTEMSQNNTHVAIYMKGVLNYTLNIFEGGVAATFVEDLKVSNGKLVTCYTCY